MKSDTIVEHLCCGAGIRVICRVRHDVLVRLPSPLWPEFCYHSWSEGLGLGGGSARSPRSLGSGPGGLVPDRSALRVHLTGPGNTREARKQATISLGSSYRVGEKWTIHTLQVRRGTVFVIVIHCEE